MTIAGTDSSGGAGIHADLRTFAAFRVHGATAVTAVTAQNTMGVSAVCALEAEMVREQIRMVTDDLTLRAVKTGMLARPHTISAVAQLARDGRLPNLVVDPVLVSSTGHALMEEGGPEAYRRELLPCALIATPNLRESAVLIGVDVADMNSVEDMVAAGRSIRDMGAQWALVKGGHFLESGATSVRAPDVLVGPDGYDIFDAPRVVTTNDHGTGCSLAAAIAANVALGLDVPAAVATAKDFVLRALRGGATWQLGQGHGPIDHLGWNS
jgi:hydroxymethylpyrimidine kinase/phosphomethylpyrimidine kinase